MKRMISPVGIGHLLDHGLQAVLEFAAVLGPGQQAADIQGDHFFVLEHLRHVALDDAQRQPLGDGGLAHAGLADQERVVLGAAHQHLHDAADLLVAADDRVQLPLARQLHQVAAVALQGLEFFLRAGVGDGLVAADLHQRLQEDVPADAEALQHPGRRFVEVDDRQEQVLRGHVLVTELAGDGRGLGQGFFHGVAQVGFRPLHLGQGGQFLIGRRGELRRVDADLL